MFVFFISLANQTSWVISYQILKEKQIWHYLTISRGNKGSQTFPKDINPKVNRARLEFELAYNDPVVQHISHYTTGIPITTTTWVVNSIILLYLTNSKRYQAYTRVRLHCRQTNKNIPPSADTRCRVDDLIGTMIKSDRWQEKVKGIRAVNTP